MAWAYSTLVILDVPLLDATAASALRRIRSSEP